MLRRHIALLYHLHLIPSMIIVITLRNDQTLTTRSKETDPETSDLLCMLLSDVLHKYSYNEKYITLIRVRLSLSIPSLS